MSKPLAAAGFKSHCRPQRCPEKSTSLPDAFWHRRPMLRAKGICIFPLMAVWACLPSRAFDCLPINRNDLLDAYQASPQEKKAGFTPGNLIHDGARTYGTWMTVFTHDGVTISVQSIDGSVISVRFHQTGSFNSFAVADLLKPLGVGQDWKQTDDTDWQLDGSPFTARLKDDWVIVSAPASQ